MSITPTYPGVYIEEIPSGQHAITPVATSIAAFVGRAPIGPVDEVLTCFSFGDFQRFYGGLSVNYPMSYAVQDFFNNGGAQAEICRLFEPTPGTGSGVAQLPFPVSAPMVPEGWMLSAPVNPGDSTVQVTAPVGSEAEPEEGMLLGINTPGGMPYTVTDFVPADPSKNKPATISFLPPFKPPVNSPYPICTQLFFEDGPAPAGWTVSTSGQDTVTVLQGSGIPEMGDTFTVGSDPQIYTITNQPTVTSAPDGSLQLQLSVTPKPNSNVIYGAKLIVSPPQPSPMPLNWQINSTPNGGSGGKPYTVDLVNGTGTPLLGDQFTVGKNATLYTVVSFAPATDKAKPQLTFQVASGGPLPSDPKAFCFCCTLNFTRPSPEDWAIAKAPKVGATQFTVGTNSGAASGVIDIGYTFEVQGDSNIYTVLLYNRASGDISFLPEAATVFSGEIVFSPPLQLVAASPGSWANMLTAVVDTDGITSATAAQFQQYDLEQEDLFNLALKWFDSRGKQIASERYLNVAVKKTGLAAHFPNRLDHVLKSQSSLARVSIMPLSPPTSGTATKGSGGNNGQNLSATTYLGNQAQQTGLYLLDKTPIFNLLCIPPDQRIFDTVPLSEQDLDPAVRLKAANYCTDRRAIFIADPPAIWEDEVKQGNITKLSPADLQISGMNSAGIEVERNVAVYFPRVVAEDVLLKNLPCVFPACGMIAGVIAATDVARGVWKSPAGIDAGLAGVSKLNVNLTDSQNGILNPLGINCLRTFPIIGPVVWGARTLRGADQFEDDYKYLSVRRLTLFIESSLYQATQWAVFEPNDEALWSSLRLSVNSFLAELAQQGAFYNYKVTCDASNNTPDDIENGCVNILVQIAPVRPAEFVMISIQQTLPSASS